MFRKSEVSQQEDFFGSFDFNFSSRKGRELNDPNSWWDLFYKYVTCKIDEALFAGLYSESMGRPNAPIRLLVAKEGFGWSDGKLFEECNFNILVMKALGLSGLNDTIPSESTYYEFKQSLYRHQVEKGADLIIQCFQRLTEAQAKLFGVSGDKIRMDSKLIGSNIADCSRLRLIVSCLLVFWNSLSKSAQSRLTKEKRAFIAQLLKKKPQQLVYRLSNEEKKQLLGGFLSELMTLYSSGDSEKILLIERVLNEQYVMDENNVSLKKGAEIDANSLQSPYDPDAAYRTKRDESVQGYSVNVTETCNAEGLNLISDIQVEPATQSDNGFVQSAIENTETVVGKVNEVSMDGADNDVSNAEYAEEHDKTLLFTGIQGAKGRSTFKMDKWLSSMEKREKFMWLKTTKRGSLSLRKTLVKLDTSHKKTLIVAPEGCKSNKCLTKQKTEETMWKLQYFSSLILPVTIKRDTEEKQNINSGQTVGPCGIIWSALPITWEKSVQILPEMS